RFRTAKDLGDTLLQWSESPRKTDSQAPPVSAPAAIRLVPGYSLLSFLGRGGLGEVWRATAPGGAECALKIIFLKEKTGRKEFKALRRLNQLRHPNLVPVHGVWLLDLRGQILGVDWDPGSTVPQGQDVELIIARGLGAKDLSQRFEECQ